ncbi:MAG: hypothetical protein ACUVS4_03905 [Chloroflexaceae bacterium]
MRITIEIDEQVARVRTLEQEETRAGLAERGTFQLPANDGGGPSAALLASIAEAGGLAVEAGVVSSNDQAVGATDAGAAPSV